MYYHHYFYSFSVALLNVEVDIVWINPTTFIPTTPDLNVKNPATIKATNVDRPLSDFVEHMETISITDSHWDTETVVKIKLNWNS